MISMRICATLKNEFIHLTNVAIQKVGEELCV